MSRVILFIALEILDLSKYTTLKPEIPLEMAEV